MERLIEYYNIDDSIMDYISNMKYTINSFGSKVFERPSIDILTTLYIEKNMMRDEMGKLFGVHDGTIKRWLSFYKIQKDKKRHYKNVEKSTIKKYGKAFYNNPEKIAETTFKRYGVRSVLQLEHVREKLYWANQEKYGVKCLLSLPMFKEKTKEFMLEKYGVDNYTKTNEYKKQINEYYDNKSIEDVQKTIVNRKATNLEKYGKEHYTQTDDYITKTTETNLEKYGNKWFLSSKHLQKYIEEYNKDGNDYYTDLIKVRKKTNLEKYGVGEYSQTDEWKEKFRNTCFQKYGVDNYTKTNEYKEKSYNTKKINGTIGKSNEEDTIYQLICSFYPNTIRHYKSDEYPFVCDFYIPDENVYIEYNGFWTHGKEQYDENNPTHITMLECMKNKNNSFYDDAITTWTIRDVKKRNIAKENNLVYYEIYNMKDMINLLEELHERI